MALRMWMYDLAREQAPTLEHLQQICELTIASGYNALGLYLEHRFAYPSTPWMHGKDCLTPESIEWIQEQFPQLQIIPFVNLLGHFEGFLYAEPGAKLNEKLFAGMQACANKPEFLELANGILDDVMRIFKSDIIHIGGDECPKDFWKKSPFCQSLIKARGLKDEHGLQSYFIQTMEKYINSKGRSIIGWDEILEGGLAPNATVMSWRGEEGGIDAARQNHDVVMTPGKYVYLDHPQTKKEDSLTIGGYLPLETVYNYEPIPSVLTPEEGKHVLGAQGNVWTEYMANPAKVEYMLFPRLSALSEVLWSEKETRNYDQFLQRLQTQYKRYQLWKVTFNRALN